MNNQKRWALALVLVLIAGMATGLSWLKSNQKLGQPGIKASSVSGSVVMNIGLPENVLDYVSTNLPQSAVVTNMLPKDTSYAQRLYLATDGFWVNANIILMGADRTSIHKPDYCLAGQGFNVLTRTEVNVPIGGSQPYELPVARWVGSRLVEASNGRFVEEHCLYVFWFVADNQQTPSYGKRLLLGMADTLRTGVLQRWAYVSYFAPCHPGEEEATFERIKGLIAASVPEFQLPPRRLSASAVAKQ